MSRFRRVMHSVVSDDVALASGTVFPPANVPRAWTAWMDRPVGGRATV